jgi:hypothetical protein
MCICTGPSWSSVYDRLNLQLPSQSVPIATKVVSSHPTHVEVCSIQRYVIKFQLFSLGIPVSFTNKTNRHDI